MSAMELLAVACGGALGAVVRFAASRWNAAWPRGTLTVNLVGSFGIGWLLAFLSPGSVSHFLWIGGFCGALTTFSSFVVETCLLVRAGRLRLASGYFLGTVLGCASAFSLARQMIEWLA